MAHRGVHFALTKEQESELLDAVGDDDAVLESVEQIEEVWEKPFYYETDAAWDAIHRCFCSGKLLYAGGTYPLNHLICGGRQLLTGEDADYTVSYVAAKQVREVAEAAASVSKEDLAARYKKIKQRGYDGQLGSEDFEYTWENFQGLVQFFSVAAKASRAVVFTVDC
jgi:hypothetical protein